MSHIEENMYLMKFLSMGIKTISFLCLTILTLILAEKVSHLLLNSKMHIMDLQKTKRIILTELFFLILMKQLSKMVSPICNFSRVTEG